MIDDRSNPTRRELLIFVLLWAVFCTLVGLVASTRAGHLLPAAIFTLVCSAIAIALDRETAASRKLSSLVIPAALGLLSFAGTNLPAKPVLWMMIAIGVIGTGVMLASRPLALAFHRFWTNAAKPIGWTISTTLLGVVYILVFTPIGLVLRTFGHDPMQRGFDRQRASYWSTHAPPPESRRYFRQY
ncbi:MAG: hypothetical protein KDA20_03225 [Phycisphaerales bacterium]|nr:hypothetical protein [Phycisphaerales bacterium]